MSQSAKTTQTIERDAPAADPNLLEQILDGMERRVTETMSRVRPIEINNFADLWRWAERASKSKMVPKDYIGNPEAIMVAVDMGAELGLRRMQSLQCIAVINGRPSIWGDGLWALIVSQPSLENVREYYEGEGENRAAVCQIKRRGRDVVEKRFSVADAKKAGLWGKAGPWTSYTDRMLQMRARGFAARDAYADALKGLITTEEAMDIPEDLPGMVTSPWRSSTPRTAPDPDAEAAPPDLATRVNAAVERILNAPRTPEAYMKLERATGPLFADLEAAGEMENHARLLEVLNELRDAAESVEVAA
ncbi:hypothetical protein [Acidiphilium sp.]|uniref:hypothetical protein n=1 Tax=Acidiphilium sp. TaxID=527 RepID=UPI003CFD780C